MLVLPEDVEEMKKPATIIPIKKEKPFDLDEVLAELRNESVEELLGFVSAGLEEVARLQDNLSACEMEVYAGQQAQVKLLEEVARLQKLLRDVLQAPLRGRKP